jgi:hypothetical protein
MATRLDQIRRNPTTVFRVPPNMRMNLTKRRAPWYNVERSPHAVSQVMRGRWTDTAHGLRPLKGLNDGRSSALAA